MAKVISVVRKPHASIGHRYIGAMATKYREEKKDIATPFYGVFMFGKNFLPLQDTSTWFYRNSDRREN